MPRVLVVYKKSAYQRYVLERRNPRLSSLLRRRHPAVLDMREAHEVHQRTLAEVERVLQREGAKAELVYRADVRDTERYDLIVSVGGDGTLLQASHAVRHAPLLGVNSDPERSEAVFCAAASRTCGRLLRRALEGSLPALVLPRLQLRHNDRPLPPLILNDVLIAHDDPATMSRYELALGARRELQKSSGLWVATAAGSSSAILAAGGRRLPWNAPQFQYRPRELYVGRLSRPRLSGGVLGAREAAVVTWLMRTGAAFIDGPHVRHPLRFGDVLTIALDAQHPLRLLGVPAMRRGP